MQRTENKEELALKSAWNKKDNSKSQSLRVVQEKKTSKGKDGNNSVLDKELQLKIHDLMVRSRALEERTIKMYKQNDGYFWIGGPGEEAFNVPLGLLTHKGQGKDFDYLHLHYRSAAVLVAMGMDPKDALRQMKNTATDPFSGGRNFSNHISISKWNVLPISSPIEVQYQPAIGTGIAQKRHGGKGISIVTGGDAGTAEGDFASCLVWSTRPNQELPILMIVTNNDWGISTPGHTQHGEKNIADRGKPFGMKTMVINGNDVEESYQKLQEAMEYIRTERKPVLMEAHVSRLYGHSSASGANFHDKEVDPIEEFEKKLIERKILTQKQIDEIHQKYTDQMRQMAKEVKQEPMPDASTIYDYTYHNQKGRYW